MNSWNIKSVAEWYDEEPGPVEPSPKFQIYCRYCGDSAAYNEQDEWGVACRDCHEILTLLSNSNLHNLLMGKGAKESLMMIRWDPKNDEWVEGLDRHWYEYDFYKPRTDGKPPLDPDYIHPENPPTAEELQRG